MSDDDPRKDAKSAPETLAAQALGRIDPETRALIPSLHLSTTYERDADGGYSSGRGYTRPHNPTYDTPEDLLATLEGGTDCLLFASGMAAAAAVFQSLLPGDHVVASRIMYWALRKWLVDFPMAWGLEVEFVDTTELDALAASMRPGKTKLVWIDTPANPTWDVTDIAGAADIAHKAGARLAVDSTVATPALMRPIELGADLVVHSASKFLNGHGDVLAGATVAAQVDGFWQRLRAWRRDAGSVLGPFEAWLLLRGMRTLFVRIGRCSESAMAIARHFEGHAQVSHVLYPGLASHPGHAIAASQMTGGFGGMLLIRLHGGEAAAVATAARVHVFKRATSLGGVESLIEHRASVEGPTTPVPPDLLRLSIGLEDVQDLIDDLEHALSPGSVGKAAPTVEAPAPAPGSASAMQAVLDDRIRPLVAERGGDLVFSDFSGGVLKLTMAGSPGASIPIRRAILNTLRHYVAEVEDVRFVAAEKGRGDGDSPADAVRRVLNEAINPAVAAHGGHIRLDRIKEGVAYVRLEGGCQGCAMAEVTLRQGVEVMIKERVPEIVGVLDVTDHGAGTDPYFKTSKGPV